MGIELAKLGSAAFIYCSQTVPGQAEMITKIKSHKAGFRGSRAIQPEILIRDLHTVKLETGFNVFPVIDGENKFLGLITRNDYDIKLHGGLKVSERMIARMGLWWELTSTI